MFPRSSLDDTPVEREADPSDPDLLRLPDEDPAAVSHDGVDYTETETDFGDDDEATKAKRQSDFKFTSLWRKPRMMGRRSGGGSLPAGTSSANPPEGRRRSFSRDRSSSKKHQDAATTTTRDRESFETFASVPLSGYDETRDAIPQLLLRGSGWDGNHRQPPEDNEKSVNDAKNRWMSNARSARISLPRTLRKNNNNRGDEVEETLLGAKAPQDGFHMILPNDLHMDGEDVDADPEEDFFVNDNAFDRVELLQSESKDDSVPSFPEQVVLSSISEGSSYSVASVKDEDEVPSSSNLANPEPLSGIRDDHNVLAGRELENFQHAASTKEEIPMSQPRPWVPPAIHSVKVEKTICSFHERLRFYQSNSVDCTETMSTDVQENSSNAESEDAYPNQPRNSFDGQDEAKDGSKIQEDKTSNVQPPPALSNEGSSACAGNPNMSTTAVETTRFDFATLRANLQSASSASKLPQPQTDMPKRSTIMKEQLATDGEKKVTSTPKLPHLQTDRPKCSLIQKEQLSSNKEIIVNPTDDVCNQRKQHTIRPCKNSESYLKKEPPVEEKKANTDLPPTPIEQEVTPFSKTRREDFPSFSDRKKIFESKPTVVLEKELPKLCSKKLSIEQTESPKMEASGKSTRRGTLLKEVLHRPAKYENSVYVYNSQDIDGNLGYDDEEDDDEDDMVPNNRRKTLKSVRPKPGVTHKSGHVEGPTKEVVQRRNSRGIMDIENGSTAEKVVTTKRETHSAIPIQSRNRQSENASGSLVKDKKASCTTYNSRKLFFEKLTRKEMSKEKPLEPDNPFENRNIDFSWKLSTEKEPYSPEDSSLDEFPIGESEVDGHPLYVTVENDFILNDDPSTCFSAYDTHQVVCQPSKAISSYLLTYQTSATKVLQQPMASGSADPPDTTDNNLLSPPLVDDNKETFGMLEAGADQGSTRAKKSSNAHISQRDASNKDTTRRTWQSKPSSPAKPKAINNNEHKSSRMAQEDDRKASERSKSLVPAATSNHVSASVLERCAFFQQQQRKQQSRPWWSQPADPSRRKTDASIPTIPKGKSNGSTLCASKFVNKDKKPDSILSNQSRKSSLSLQDVLESRQSTAPSKEPLELTTTKDLSVDIRDNNGSDDWINMDSNVRPSELLKRAKPKPTTPAPPSPLITRRGFSSMIRSPKSNTTNKQQLRCF